VTSAGMTCMFPSSRGNFLARVEIEGRLARPEEQNLVNHRMVTPGFFETTQIPLLRGRAFERTDGPEGEPVVIVIQAMARRYWPEEDPLGKRLRNLSASGDVSAWMRVVGIAGDLREFYDVDETWYLPYAQRAQTRMAGRATFVVRGLLMAALGIYGVLSYAVSRRSREIGIRMALGARPGDIRRKVLGGGTALIGAGMGLGLIGALGLSRLLASLVTEVEATDPATLVGVTLILTLVALQACWFPARRAMRADPVTVLREE